MLIEAMLTTWWQLTPQADVPFTVPNGMPPSKMVPIPATGTRGIRVSTTTSSSLPQSKAKLDEAKNRKDNELGTFFY